MTDLTNGWSLRKLADLVDDKAPIVYGIVQAGPEYPGGIPYIKSSDVGGSICSCHLSLTSPTIAAKYQRSLVVPGDIVFSLRGNIGELSIVPDDLPYANLTQGTARIRPRKNVDNRFLAFALRSPALSMRIATVGKGSTFKEISLEELRKLDLQIPSYLVQQKIATILSVWDQAIEKAISLAEKERHRYNVLRRTLTTSTRNGREFPSVHLAEIANRIRRKNDGNDHPVMTVSSKSGFLLQSDKYARDMAGSSVENYIVLHRGEFAYNKGNSLTSPQGCIFRLDEEMALVPHVYFCFALNDCLHADFFVHLFESGYLNHQLSRVINSGVRNDGLLNLNPDDFFKCRVPLPTHEEQFQTAQVLNDLKRGVELQKKKVDLLKTQKRGLMQKLLTGKWRVTV